MKNAQLKNTIISTLKQIPDPELGVSIWDLGLIYKIIVKGSKIDIIMTLTTIGCPLFSQIADPIKQEVEKLKGVSSVFIDLTFDPPWTPEKMSEDARVSLGL